MRRKTFNVTITKGTAFPTPTPFEVLALDQQSAIDWLNRNGYKVHSIAPKPRRKHAKRWKLDEDAFQAVKDTFGLRYPVYLTTGRSRREAGWSQTCYGWQLPESAPAALRAAAIVHRIHLTELDSPRETSRTIWHELCHAWQAERTMATVPGMPSPTARMRAWRAAMRVEHAINYRIRPCEVEAREWEQHADEIAAAVAP